jgi:hypothetical protein
MTRIVRVTAAIALGVALIAATASAAGAYQFKAASYPVIDRANSATLHGFEITGAVSVCRKATFKTGEEGAPNPTAAVETLVVHPIYSECEVSIAGTFKAKVITTGCNYDFHAAQPSTKGGSVDIACASGKQIEVVVEGLSGCVISVGTQTGIKAVEYVNESGKVKVNAEATGIKYKASSACGIALEGSNAKYRAGEFVGGVAKLAPEGHPASALSAGFNELEEVDPVEVG